MKMIFPVFNEWSRICCGAKRSRFCIFGVVDVDVSSCGYWGLSRLTGLRSYEFSGIQSSRLFTTKKVFYNVNNFWYCIDGYLIFYLKERKLKEESEIQSGNRRSSSVSQYHDDVLDMLKKNHITFILRLSIMRLGLGNITRDMTTGSMTTCGMPTKFAKSTWESGIKSSTTFYKIRTFYPLLSPYGCYRFFSSLNMTGSRSYSNKPDDGVIKGIWTLSGMRVKLTYCSIFFFGIPFLWNYFRDLPLVRCVSFQKIFILYVLCRFLVFLFLYRIIFFYGYLFMDELKAMVAPYLPSSSGGMSGSSFQPPLPSGEPSFLPIGSENNNLEREDESSRGKVIIESPVASVGDLLDADPNFDQEAGANVDRQIITEIELTIENKLRTYWKRPRVVQRFPNIGSFNFSDLAKHLAPEELDLKSKSTKELLDPFRHVQNINNVCSLFDVLLGELNERSDE